MGFKMVKLHTNCDIRALLAQVLFMHETMQWDYLIAAIPTFLVAIYTRSLLGTVLTGVVVIILLRFSKRITLI